MENETPDRADGRVEHDKEDGDEFLGRDDLLRF